MASEGASREEDTVVSAEEILRNQRREEELAQRAYLRARGLADVCTYSRGYIDQPVYACLDCTRSDGAEPAGICLGCSMECHNGPEHTLVELYAKRGFRCDCGNSKFSGVSPCQLEPNKDPLNEDNKYNTPQNFRGLYCFCHGTYDRARDHMLPCLICEDWFHDRCLHTRWEDIPDDLHFVCRNCLARPDLEFLHSYLQLPQSATSSEQGEPRVTIEDEEDDGGERPARRARVCTRPRSEPRGSEAFDEFLLQDLHKRLCTCPDCVELYGASHTEFLLLTPPAEEDDPNRIHYDDDDDNDEAEDEGTTQDPPSQHAAPASGSPNAGGVEGVEEASLFDRIALPCLERLPRDDVARVSGGMHNFIGSVVDELRQWQQGHSGQVVTDDVIRGILPRVMERLRRDNLNGDSATGAYAAE